MDMLVGRIEQVFLQRCVEDLVRNEQGLSGAMFCTSDGFELASVLPDAVSAASLSAMASSQFALGDAMCREAGLKDCQDLVVDAPAGAVLLMVVPGTQRGLVLAAIGNKRHVLGQVLYACKQAANEIGERIAGAHR